MLDKLLNMLTLWSSTVDLSLSTALAVPILVFVTVMLIYLALTAPDETIVQRRLRVYGYDLHTQPTGDLHQPVTVRVVLPMWRWTARLVNRLTPGSIVNSARARLREAGEPLDLTTLLLLRAAVTVFLPIAYLVPTLLAIGNARLLDWVIGAFLLYLGNRLPDIWLSFRIDDRRAEITRSLSDALDLIVVCVEAGYGLEAAIAKVVESTKGPLSQEFGQMLSEISVGRPRREALHDLGVRCGAPDLQTFISSILQADQMGVAIADALRVQADAIRVRRRQRAEEAIAKAPVKMLLPLTVCIFPALLVVIAGPAALRVMTMFQSLP